MHTEDEAKTKRCPMSYTAAGYAAVTAPSCCIASACMAWRVGREAVPPVRGDVVGRDEVNRADYYGPDRALASPALGFCGLSGPSAMPPTPPGPVRSYKRREWSDYDHRWME